MLKKLRVAAARMLLKGTNYHVKRKAGRKENRPVLDGLEFLKRMEGE